MKRYALTVEGRPHNTAGAFYQIVITVAAPVKPTSNECICIANEQGFDVRAVLTVKET